MTFASLYRIRAVQVIAIFCAAFVICGTTYAQQIKGMPKLPTSGNMGLQGSVGVGFADFSVEAPEEDFKMDRGTFFSAAIERGFDFMHLYLTLSLSHMTAEGLANYDYQNLSTSTNYSVNDIAFKAAVTDLGLGLKLKLIDNYWFRPYIEFGGLGGYHQITYTSKQSVLAGIGSDYKSKDTVMGSGYYTEGGIEAMFSQAFGVKLSARLSSYKTKDLETLDKRSLDYDSETYYFAMLFGF
jgi:hypothetical protein